MDAEERLKAMTKKWEADLIARIKGASESGKADIEKWVADYIAALQVEMPLSVKQVLDRGGAIRSIVFKGKAIDQSPSVTLQVSGWGEQIYLPELSLAYFPGNLRVTLIFEQTDKAS